MVSPKLYIIRRAAQIWPGLGVRPSKSLVKASSMARSCSSTCWGRPQAYERLYTVERQGRDFFDLFSKWSLIIPWLYVWMLLLSRQIILMLDKSTPPDGQRLQPPYKQFLEPPCDDSDRAYYHSACSAYLFPCFFEQRLLFAAWPTNWPKHTRTHCT